MLAAKLIACGYFKRRDFVRVLLYFADLLFCILHENLALILQTVVFMFLVF